MDRLVRAIRDLEQSRFQELCFQLLSEKYPRAGVRYVEGLGGDEGVDTFAGELTHGPTVWQAKAFHVTAVGDAQKQQIRKSLRDVIQNVAPHVWVLCLNINLDTKAHRWFQHLRQSYARKLLIADPMQGEDIAKELIFRKTLREHYFPELGLQPADLRALVAGTHALDDEHLRQRAHETVQQWIDRIKDKDPRLSYEISFGGDRGPQAFPPLPEHGLIAAMTDGQTTIKAFARDEEALRLDPLGFTLTTNEAGARKIIDFVRTGRDQLWHGNEILDFSSNLPLLRGVSVSSGARLEFRSLSDNRMIPLRLTFRNANRRVILEYVPFRKARGGTAEVEIETTGDSPLRMRLILPRAGGSTAQATVSRNLVGKTVRAVAQVCSALQTLQEGCDVEMYSLQLSANLGILQTEPLQLGVRPEFFSFIGDLMAIATRFGIDPILPDGADFDDEAEKGFMMLRAFVRNQPLSLEDYTMNLVKSKENEELLPEQLKPELVFWVQHDNATANLFGTEFSVGPCGIHIERAAVKDLEKTIARFRKAKIGETVRISVRPLTPVRFLLLPSADAPIPDQ